jgi:hypothetical protein
MNSTETTYESISNVAKLFYQLRFDEGIKQFATLTDEIITILRNCAAGEQDIQHVQAILTECMTAYQHKEYILLADLIQYELAQIFAP